MNSIQDYITDNLIIDILCKARIKIADRIRKRELIKNLESSSYQFIPNEIDSEIIALLPPRKKWKKLGKEKRMNGDQTISTFVKNVKRLKITIKFYNRNAPTTEFYVKLNQFIIDVRHIFNDDKYSISKPETFPIAKNSFVNSNGKIECRPITTYTRLLDMVVIKIANKYLSELFDSHFCNNNSLAFRIKRTYYGQELATTHNEAVDRISDYQNDNRKKRIYVSECDIKKFYDSVDHNVIKECFEWFLNEAQQQNLDIDTKIIKHIFYSYLDSYSFYDDVYSKNNDALFWSDHNVTNGEFKWIYDELKKNMKYSHKKIQNSKIGIPQGGALSGLISNIVLDFADKKILAYNHHSKVLYIRFCDDIIILSSNIKVAKRLTSIYNKSLRKLKLIPHKAKKAQVHDKKFWSEKSKEIYRWGTSKEEAPWIGFVGYEFRRTGELRVRKASIQKEVRKQKEVVNNVLKIRSIKSKGYLMESIINRIIGMSVGRVSLWNYKKFKNELCWVSGFNRLKANKYLNRQLKHLDRCRNIHIGRANLKLVDNSSKVINVSNSNKRQITKYYGGAFSYYRHISKPKK